MSNKRTRGVLYILAALLLGIRFEVSHHLHVTFPSLFGAAGMFLLLIAAVCYFAYWVWARYKSLNSP